MMFIIINTVKTVQSPAPPLALTGIPLLFLILVENIKK